MLFKNLVCAPGLRIVYTSLCLIYFHTKFSPYFNKITLIFSPLKGCQESSPHGNKKNLGLTYANHHCFNCYIKPDWPESSGCFNNTINHHWFYCNFKTNCPEQSSYPIKFYIQFFADNLFTQIGQTHGN